MLKTGVTTLTKQGAKYIGAYGQEEYNVPGMKLNIIGVQDLAMVKQNSIPSMCHLIHHWVFIMEARKERVCFGVQVTLSNVKVARNGYVTSATVHVKDVADDE